jgi:hypothetical protein
MKAQDLIGKFTHTKIAVPSTGRILAYPYQYIDGRTAKEIARLASVMADIVKGIRPGDIFQTWQAEGTGLIDENDKVY